jgi:hypothetical protein
MKFRAFVKNIFSKSAQDYKRNKKFLTLLSFFCIVSIFIPVLLEDAVMPVLVSVLILLPGWILLYMCVYCAFFAAKGKKLTVAQCLPGWKTVFKSLLVSFAGIVVFSVPFMIYFAVPAGSEPFAAAMIAYIAGSVLILLFAGWAAFLCFYGILDGKPLKEVFIKGLKYLKKNLFKLFALLFIVLLVFMAADMTVIGLFFVFPFILVIFANIYLQFYDAQSL